MNGPGVISLQREGGMAVIKPVTFLGDDGFKVYRKATEGAIYEKTRKANLATLDKVPGILTRLREADFEVRVSEELTQALAEHTTQLWLDVQGAKERVEAIDAEICARTKNKTGLFPFQKTGATWLAMHHGALLADEQGLGKAQPVDTVIPTPDGPRSMGSLCVGDNVFGSNGCPIRVLGVFAQGRRQVFEVVLTDGSVTRCCGEHLWTIHRKRRKGRRETLSLQAIQRESLRRLPDNGHNFFVPVLTGPLRFTKEETLEIHPYLLGALLANGSLGQSIVHSGTPEQRDKLQGLLPEGLFFRACSDGCSFRITTGTPGRENALLSSLRGLGLLGSESHTKKVPEKYLRASVENRLALVQGLFDNDGTCGLDGGVVEYNTTSPDLAKDVLDLIRGLGGTARMSTRVPKFTNKLGEKVPGRVDYRIRPAFPEGMTPFTVPSKLARYRPRSEYPPAHAIASISPAGEAECVCILVSAPDRLYVTEDKILTHNTLQTIASLPARTAALVVAPAVAKGVWRREIRKWRPSLRVSLLEGRASFRWPQVGEVLVTNYELLPEAHLPECLAKRKSKVKLFGKHKKDCLRAQANVFIPAISEMAKRCKGCLPESEEAKQCKGCAPFLDGAPENMTVVADEAHALKNPNAQRTVRFRGISDRIRSRHGRVWLLTGTPLLNNPPELWSVLAAAQVATDTFGTFKQFVELFGGRSKGDFGGYVWSGPKDDLEVASRMQRVMLRRVREEVMPELPRKTIQIWPVAIDEKLSKACDEAVNKHGGLDALTESLKLGVSFTTMARIRSALATAKMPAMLSMVEEAEEAGEPLVVFSAHRGPIDALAKRKGWAVITGDTSPEERTEIEDRFQAGELLGVGATIKAGGVAITLTRACQAVFVDLEWTPGLNEQAEDRVCRIGQTRPVLIRVLVAEHKLDERVAELLEEKEWMIDASVNAARERPDGGRRDGDQQKAAPEVGGA